MIRGDTPDFDFPAPFVSSNILKTQGGDQVPFQKLTLAFSLQSMAEMLVLIGNQRNLPDEENLRVSLENGNVPRAACLLLGLFHQLIAYHRVPSEGLGKFLSEKACTYTERDNILNLGSRDNLLLKQLQFRRK